ncbi:ion transporter [Methanogenium organophilum]|uniref:Ion transporter n=1 Tax=Methanogenium organophilum TaxID=2199 RepID=A0A9X9S5E5_METOG|nr:ion transporter [Methanogenium organophilum]WAI02073.1 ion transporter [Methanogenium organophilum]
MGRIKTRVFEIVSSAKEGDRTSFLFDMVIIGFIILSVGELIIASIPGMIIRYFWVFVAVEILTAVVFSIEYILRMWSCTVDERYQNPISGRIRFALTPLVLIDLVSILPYYLTILIPGANVTFLRTLRVFRFFKLGRYSRSFGIMIKVLERKKESLVGTVFIIMVVLIIAASLMYRIEYTAQPEVFSSIPEAMWWGIVTIATIGYGDMVPITPMGKGLGFVISLIGIGLFALPAGILASGFSEVIKEEEERKEQEKTEKSGISTDDYEICPHCGREIRPEDKQK